MLLLDGFENFNRESILDAIRKGIIEPSNRVIMLFLYNKRIFAEMLACYGVEIQKELATYELYTYYPSECSAQWKNYPGELKVNRQNFYEIRTELAFSQMEKIAESYGVGKSQMPCLILINSEDGRFISYPFKMKENNFSSNSDEEKKFKENCLRKMLKVIRVVQNTTSFEDLETEIKKKSSDGFELFIFSDEIRTYIMENLKRNYRRDINKKEELVINSLGISNRNFNARMVNRENQPLMRDEVIAIAITLGLDIDKTNVLLKLSNYEHLTYRNERDVIFMNFINKYIGKTFYNIMSDYPNLLEDDSYMLNYLDFELNNAKMSPTEHLK